MPRTSAELGLPIADDADDADVIRAMKSLRAHIRAKSLALCRKTRDAAGVQRRWSLFVTEKAKFSTYDTPVWHRPKDECGGGSAWAAGFIHAFHFSSTPLVGTNQLRRADLLAALCQESAGDFSRVTAAELAAAEAAFAGKEARLPGAGSGWSGVLECPCTTRRAIDLANNTIDGEPFTSRCVAGGPLARTNNTICTLAGYAAHGGMQCCKDGMVLLDADQPDHPPTTYYHKLRVYFEDGPPPPGQAPAAKAHPQNAFRLYWQTEEWMGEYNVPQCSTGTPPSACVHTLTTTLHAYELFGGLTSPTDDHRLNCSIVTDVWCGDVQAVEAAGGKFKLLNMAFHQHSPAVLSGELYNDETGELICRNAPIRGATVGAPLDEKGYGVGIPPCVWGSAAEGLPPPVLDLRTRLLVIAKYNSSVPHYGVMAMWQGRGGL